ncbi:MAG: phosphoribosylformylglycinamidine cyclo-ligase [Chloroflexi bacterium]|nr:phosphoribosylformylglycinamidine cyclo-ligase [Chloroflexota bacterium]
MTEQTYGSAGVNLDAAQDVKRLIGAIVSPTHGPQVLGGIGGFGAMYRLAGYEDPVLVSSTDGVGTKLKIAIWMDRYDTIGEDLVNACVNDIVVSGAKPLFFLDYLAVGVLDARVVESLISGMARACKQADCALIGGETAQMPGVYADKDFDMAGFVVGAVESRNILDGSKIAKGDILIGIPSNGLHTNGYSLVRHVLGLDSDQAPLEEYVPELAQTLGEALLTPHMPYYRTVRDALPMLKGMAHITGGGLVENVPRVLPDGTGARFDTSTWEVPPIFTVLQERSNISREEMYRVFNMGLGMVLVCDRADADRVLASVPESRVVGEVTETTGDQRVAL